MRPLYLLLFSLVVLNPCLGQQTLNQQSLVKKKVPYTVEIERTDGKPLRGSIYQTADSSMLVAETYRWFKPNQTSIQSISADNILKINYKARGQATRGVWIGMVAGAFIGGIIGHQNHESGGNKIPPGIFFAGGAIVGAPIGALLGGALGTIIHETIPINGSNNTYAAQREKLRRLSITGQ